MKHKNLSKFVFAPLLIALLVALPFAVKSLRGFAAANEYSFTGVDGLYFKQLAYHGEMNELFNKNVEALVEGTGSLEMPENDNCDNNISTYCVAKTAADMLFTYKEELLIEKSSLDEEVKQAQADGDTFFQVIFEANREKAQNIDNELITAEKVLNLALSAYNEMQVAYPLHRQYLDMIDNLEVYRANLEGIENYTKSYPNLFVNATTTQCQ